tara:strand:- start:122 stop:754 length:633 start_codon:yes stop_codon:yes gene_type:complete
MKKKDKFIFYLGGIASPYLSLFIWIIAGIIVLSILFSPLSQIITFIVFPILGFKYIRKFHRYQLRKYIRDLEQSSKDKISSLARHWWNLHVVIFPVLLILIAIAIPAFVGIKTYPSASAVKNGLANGVKECVVKNFDKQTTRFSDAQSFQGNYTQFKIQSLDPNSCYKAKAVPTNDQNTWFKIDLNNETGKVSKTCGDSSKPGCEEGNTW